MKVFVLVLVVLLAGCAVDIPIHDYQSICEWIHDNVPYERSPDEEIRSPKETLELGGDCLELALLMMWMVKEEYGVRGTLASDGGHAIVLLDIYYDPSRGISRESVEDFDMTYTYSQAMVTEAWF
jgi:hypothetical protein